MFKGLEDKDMITIHGVEYPECNIGDLGLIDEGTMTVELFGLNEEVNIDKNYIVSYETSCGDIYEEAYRLEDGRWIAFDEAICSWVCLG